MIPHPADPIPSPLSTPATGRSPSGLTRARHPNPTTRAIFSTLHYGFYDGVPHTLEEIGEERNLTQERIRQLETLALCRLFGTSDPGWITTGATWW